MLPIGPYQLKNRFMLAPMAGVSEMPFRVLAFRMGAALCPTELVSAQGLWRVNARTLRYLRHDPLVEVPWSLQLFGGEVEAMVKAALVGRQYGAQLIDLNMGCPVKKVTRTGAGSALLCDTPRAAELVRRIREATGLPVTAKIRSGWDASSRNYREMADALGAAGVAALAIHPRTRAQGYSGRADWSAIAELKRHVGSAFPVIGNGDVKTPADARRMLEQTGCDYVMIGRAALGNPWIFREVLGGPGPSREERALVVLAHFRAHVAFGKDLGHRDPAFDHERGSVHAFRKHLGWYSHGLFGAAAFRARVNSLDTAKDVEDAVERFFLGADADTTAPAAEPELDYRQALG